MGDVKPRYLRAAALGFIGFAAITIGFGAVTMVAAGCDGGGASIAPPDTFVAPECLQNDQCSAPAAPICSLDGKCVGCSSNEECKAIDATAGLCASDGACVACRGSDDCADPNAPVCDKDTRTCRACTADADCGSGVCDLDEGRCVAALDVYMVDDDAPCATGDGSEAAPFCTIAEALVAFTAVPRNFIAVRDGQYVFPTLASGPLPAFIGTAAAQIGPEVAGNDCLRLDASASVLVRGFHFVGCDIALRLGAAASQVRVSNTIIDGCETGIECRADLCVVSGVQVNDTGAGIRCAGGARCSIQDSVVSGGDRGIVAATAQLQVADSMVSGAGLVGLDLTDSEVEIRNVSVLGVGVGTTGLTVGVGCANGYCAFDRLRVVGSRGPGLIINNSSFEVYSSAILDNGSDDPTLTANGGVVLLQPGSTKIFQNNTVAGNRAAGAATAGVRCGGPVTLRSSIVWGNTGAPIDAGCAATYCDIDAATLVPGVGNISLDPKLTGMTAGAMDEHLAADSPCIDQGDPAGGPTADIDGQARPAGGRVDIGADEHSP